MHCIPIDLLYIAVRVPPRQCIIPENAIGHLTKADCVCVGYSKRAFRIASREGKKAKR
jgi:hypothetical protein